MVAKKSLDPARLRETGEVGGGMSLSPRKCPRDNRLRTSLRCNQDSSIRVKNNPQSISPKGKFTTSSAGGEWRRMSLTGILVGEAMAEILQASKFAGDMVAAVADKGGKSRSISRSCSGKQRYPNQKQSRKIEQVEIIISLFSCSPEYMFADRLQGLAAEAKRFRQGKLQTFIETRSRPETRHKFLVSSKGPSDSMFSKYQIVTLNLHSLSSHLISEMCR